MSSSSTRSQHLRSDHPQLADKVTREDIVALIEIVD